MIDESIIKRVNDIDSFYIPHYFIEQAISGIKKTILLSRSSKEPICSTLTGPAGTGKTTTCELIVNEYKRKVEKREGKETWIIPAFYSSVPSPVTIKGVASAMLYSMGDPAPTKGTALELTYRLGKLIQQCETEIIILDELHHLFGKEESANDLVRDWLKTLINQFKVSVLIVGMNECNIVIDKCAQLSRRFSHRFELNNFNLDFDDDNCLFDIFIKKLCVLFKTNVPEKSFPDFHGESNRLALYLATGGNPANTVKLFKAALMYSFENNKKFVNFDAFTVAFSQLTLPNSLLNKAKEFENPFEYEERKLKSLIKNIKKQGDLK